ncbi:MAG: tRNA (guanosine(46)-N7)-methyltransferase TrmB [Gammaproteobacteria bacterium]
MNDKQGAEHDKTVPRRIRSFVRRDSRITKAQAEALDAHLSSYRFSSAEQSFEALGQLNLEIGAGDGACTLALASVDPHAGFVASEVYRAGLGRLLNAVNAGGVDNVRVIDEDIVEVLPLVPAEYFDRAMIFFPDPWPKKKHHKRRLIQQKFLASLARVLKHSGCLFMATDIEDYAEHMLEQIEISEYWRNLAGAGRWAVRPIFRPQTKFEFKGIRAGRRIFEIIGGRTSRTI